ncbi:MAG: hypothetical protein J6C37_02010 [Roseburia sp.]|nr:hypothetical protein [Roseburia sp.]
MAKSKKKVSMPAGIRNKLMAATCMLLVSCIMMISSTYAWFTLSTAPEVKNISTTVAGNGSLEIALMPEDGLLGSISSGFSSSANGGTVELITANNTWGNVITMTAADGTDVYGLKNVTLNPVSLNYKVTSETEDAKVYDYTKLEDTTKPLAIPVFGYDGRVEKLDTENIGILAYSDESKKFSSTGYGVRAIGELSAAGSELDNAYAYAIDLAFRLNTGTTASDGETATSGKLLLQTEGIQRIYNGETASTNTETLGQGSYMSFNTQGSSIDMTSLMQAIRVTFIQNYGLSDTVEEGEGESIEPVILGTARLDIEEIQKGATEIKVPLYMTSVDEDGKVTYLKEENKGVILNSLQKNTAAQVTAVVWLDGTMIKNSSVLATKINDALMQSTLNLQFSTDVTLKPAQNNALIEGNAQ